MRELDEAGVSYEMSSYPTDGEIGAVHTAQLLGVSPEVIYKTLVLEDGNGGHFVAVIAAQAELDLKKTAAHFGVCLLYTSPSPRDGLLSRMPSSA